jgi:DNA-binding response OmpR family regulator
MHHIAIIEDESGISSLLADCLASEGFQVTTAPDGQAGLDLVRRLPPDLVILDLFLPHASGLDVFDSLKARKETRPIPVVILSADKDVRLRISLLEAGADDYIVKPCSVREIVARSRAVLRRAGRTSTGGEG